MKNNKHLIDVAMHRAKADMVLKNGNVINVFTNEIIRTDVAIADGYIAALGEYSCDKNIDCTDKYISPGFIDAHMHIESTMVTPTEFAKAAAISGSTAVIADPHEIVNVCGGKGLRYFLQATEHCPISVYFMLPSSVPASIYETNGCAFTAADMHDFISLERVLGLGEVMCYPAVTDGEEEIMKKLALSAAAGKKADGHAPDLTGEKLYAYAAAGISTEHECTTFAQAQEKARAGLAILVREGSAAKNLTAIVSGLIDSGLPTDRFMFCTDDKHLDDIAREGHVRWNIRQAISLGLSPITAIKMATRNTALEYGLKDMGAVAAGYRADIVVLNHLKQVDVAQVYKDGVELETQIDKAESIPIPDELLHSVHYKDITAKDITLQVDADTDIIDMVPYQIITRHLRGKVPSINGCFTPNSEYTKLCVVERHGKNGNIAVAPLKGYGITGGAIATSVAHDSHNIIAAGDNDEDIVLAVNALRDMGGGYVLCAGGKITDSLPLRVAGLMSTGSAEQVRESTARILAAAQSMGIPYYVDPFISLSFMALPVLGELRLTDKGLFDVQSFSIVRK